MITRLVKYHNSAIRKPIPATGFNALEKEYQKKIRDILNKQVHKSLTKTKISHYVNYWKGLHKADTIEEMNFDDYVDSDVETLPTYHDNSNETKEMIALLLLMYILAFKRGVKYDKIKLLSQLRALNDSRVDAVIASIHVNNFELTNPKILSDLLKNATIVTDSLNATSKKRISTFIKKKVVEGLSADEIAKAVKELEDINKKRGWNIARNELANVKTQEVKAFMEARNMDYTKWGCQNPQDTRCLMNCGTVRQLGMSYPSGDIEPPVHNNCVCEIVPYIPEGTLEYETFIRAVVQGDDWTGD